MNSVDVFLKILFGGKCFATEVTNMILLSKMHSVNVDFKMSFIKKALLTVVTLMFFLFLVHPLMMRIQILFDFKLFATDLAGQFFTDRMDILGVDPQFSDHVAFERALLAPVLCVVALLGVEIQQAHSGEGYRTLLTVVDTPEVKLIVGR